MTTQKERKPRNSRKSLREFSRASGADLREILPKGFREFSANTDAGLTLFFTKKEGGDTPNFNFISFLGGYPLSFGSIFRPETRSGST